MLVPARMLSMGGASTWIFLFFVWATAQGNTVANISMTI
jgi:hypothetical protein